MTNIVQQGRELHKLPVPSLAGFVIAKTSPKKAPAPLYYAVI